MTREQWEAKARRDLDPRPLASLERRTADGIVVSPLYMAEDAPEPVELPPRRRAEPGWWPVAELRHADPHQANAAARADVARGAAGVWFVIDDELQAGREPSSASATGLVCDPGRELEILLDGLDPRATAIYVETGLSVGAWAEALEEWLDERLGDQLDEPGIGPAGGGVVYDPISPLLRTGRLERSFDAALGELVDVALGSVRGVLGISTAVYHEAGASEVEELALALATCAELLRRGEALGLEPSDFGGSELMWLLPVGDRPFESIAKLRAARIVWAKLCAACGLDEDDAKLWIHATGSRRIWTRRDPWVNLLRGTVGGFAAAVGGADSIVSAPFDGLCGPEGAGTGGLGRGSELGRRLALNTQLILAEESHLGRVHDPAGGSWYVESLTDALARAAWARFREIEAQGGLVEGLRAGSIQATIAASAQELRARVATRERPITGVSTFPLLDERATPEQGPNRRSDARVAPIDPGVGPLAEVQPLAPLRLAEPFEALRDAAEAWAREHGARPRIFALKLGPLAHHQARADFAANCFRAGGLELVGGPVPGEPEAALAAFAASGCKLAVVCGRDPDYPPILAKLLADLRAAGAEQAWIAGRPPKPGSEAEQAWGLDPESPPPRFVHLGCDLLAELEHALVTLGVLAERSTQALQEEKA